MEATWALAQRTAARANIIPRCELALASFDPCCSRCGNRVARYAALPIGPVHASMACSFSPEWTLRCPVVGSESLVIVVFVLAGLVAYTVLSSLRHGRH
jgi:hypothetical protein